MKTKFVLFSAIACGAILFSSCGSTTFAISSGDESLTALTKVTDNEEPCITPYGGDDGRDLYFAARESKKYYNIYKKENAFSQSMAQKTSGKNFNISPTFCAKTDKIAFKCQNEGSSTSDIFLMSNSKSAALSPITESSDAYEGHPSFSPDGTLIVYDKVQYSYYKSFSTLGGLLFGAVNTVVVKNSELWVKNLKTNETILLGNGSQPRFSPDGKRIAYVKYSSDAQSCSIWTMDIDGSNPVQVTDAKKGFATSPCWSPDGSKILFSSYKKDKKDYDLYVIGVDGNGLMQLTKNKSYDDYPYWTRDGYIYFTSDRGGKSGNYQIWRFKYGN